MNNKDADQTTRMRRLICAFVVRIWHKTRFLMAWLTYISSEYDWVVRALIYKLLINEIVYWQYCIYHKISSGSELMSNKSNWKGVCCIVNTSRFYLVVVFHHHWSSRLHIRALESWTIVSNVAWLFTLLPWSLSSKHFSRTCSYFKCMQLQTTVSNHLYVTLNLRYSKWWSSFRLCCFWRSFCVYEDLILLWFW